MQFSLTHHLQIVLTALVSSIQQCYILISEQRTHFFLVIRNIERLLRVDYGVQ